MAVFQAVAETGSFRGAAKRLNLSPSVISHHVSQLEAYFGIALFYRTTRRISLTDAGAELLTASRTMTTAAERGIEAMRRRADQPVGRLRITCPTVLEKSPYVETFLEFSRAYPKVELSVNYTFRTVELEGSDFDLAIRGTAAALDDSTYKARRIGQTTLIAVAAPGYLNARPPLKNVADISGWDMVQFPPSPWSRAQALMGIGKEVGPPRFPLITDSHEAALRYVLDGQGVGLFDRVLIRDDLKAGRLVRILTEVDWPAISMWAIWPANAGPDSLALRFVDFAAPRWQRVARESA